MKAIFSPLLSIFPDLKKNQTPYNARPIELFRISFGVLIILQILNLLQKNFIKEDLIKPLIHFHFPFLSFIQPLSEPVLNAILLLNILAGALIFHGKFVKIGLGYFLVSFTYLWLIDMGYYNNHYYLFSLLALLLLLVPGLGENGWKIKRKAIQHSLPRWAFQILKFQWFIVFFIAGVNKLNKYWLVDFQPMLATFQFKAKVSGNEMWNNEFFPILFSYGGAIFDLSIGFLLIYNKTRKFAFFLLIGFNLFNGLFFSNIGEIGVFPFLVVSSILVFLDTKPTNQKNKISTKSAFQKSLHFALWFWILFQFLFPFRHVLYPGYVDWTGEGKRFSWRMKIAYKATDINFFIQENGEGTKFPVNIQKSLTPKQYNNLGYDLDFLPQIGQLLEIEAKKLGLKNPIVIADFKVGLNGQPTQYIISPDLPLNKTKYSIFRHNEWIKPQE